MALRWRNSYSCNISEIDNQHKKLFEICSKLNILQPICYNIDFRDEIKEIINDLKEYTIYHFEYEESLLKKYNYNEFERQHREHEGFVRKIAELDNAINENNNPEFVKDIVDFVTGWITAHILNTDMMYKEFLNGLGIY